MKKIASCGTDATVRVLLAFVVLLFAATAFAQNVTGVVTNGTTNKPASGVEVTLITLGQGMTEAGSTKTDSQGKYSLALDSSGGPHLIRATYQGANYFKMVPPGFTSGNVEVYESAKKVEGISGNVNIIRMQADSNTLQFMELFAVRNNSTPPRTLAADTTFEIVLPDGAVIDEADAASPNGQPIQTTPVALKQKGHYGFPFALKPGETRFQVAYHIPYAGQAAVSPKLTIPFDHFVVMTPPSMKVGFKNPALFQPMNDQGGANVQVSNSVRSGQDVSFNISGTGTITDTQNAQGQGGTGDVAANQNATVNRVGPGGGLGTPIDAPDALSQYRWLLLGVMLIVLFGVSYLMLSRTAAPTAVAAGAGTMPVPATPEPVSARIAPSRSAQPQNAPAGDSSTALLQAMKEELFALEIERQQGQISQKDYEEQKSALDQTLKRALARAGKKS